MTGHDQSLQVWGQDGRENKKHRLGLLMETEPATKQTNIKFRLLTENGRYAIDWAYLTLY